MIRRRTLQRIPLAQRQPHPRFSASTSTFPGIGGYEGGRSDRSATRNWLPRIGSPDSDVVPDLQPVRSRGRDLARNAPLIAGALDTNLSSIVGPGLVPHPRLDRAFLGLTEEQANDWQRQASRIWWAVAGSTELDIRRRFNFAQLTHIMLRSYMTDGDHFFRRRFKERKGSLLGLKIQLIEADRISNPNNKPDTPTLIEGVEIDDDGAFVKFHVMDRHPGEILSFTAPKWTEQPAFGPETGEALMRQVASIERDGQTRGISLLAPVIESVKQLTRYGGAELDAAVATSFISLIIESEGGALGELPSMGTGANEAPVGFTGGAASASADRQIHLAPAAVVGLRPGEKISTFNPNRPNTAFEAFFRAWCSIVGVGIGLPHELLIKHFTSSYSASRGAMLEAWRGFLTRRSLIVVDQWAQPVWEWMVSESVARGYLSAPGYFDDPLIKAAYCECQWTGPIMGQLNPLDEANAAKIRIDTGTSTLEEETAANTGGDDWSRKHEQRAREHAMRVKAGLEPEIANVSTRAAINEAAPTSTADQRDTQDNQDKNNNNGNNGGGSGGQ